MYLPWQTAPRAIRAIQTIIVLENVRDIIRGSGTFIAARTTNRRSDET